MIDRIKSERELVTSVVPQCSVLAPGLSIIDINDVEVRISNLISKFADHTRIGNLVLTTQTNRGSKRSIKFQLGLMKEDAL